MKSPQVLLYNFTDSERRQRLKQMLNKLKISAQSLPFEAYDEKVGNLLAVGGAEDFSANADTDFSFDEEVMIIDGLRGKKMDKFLLALKEAGLTIKYKSVATPFNRLWTLRRLCETMRREHGMMDGEA